jgi:hypothetical protein
MKKRNIVIHCLVLLMLIATFVACASTPTRESTGEYVQVIPDQCRNVQGRRSTERLR